MCSNHMQTKRICTGGVPLHAVAVLTHSPVHAGIATQLTVGLSVRNFLSSSTHINGPDTGEVALITSRALQLLTSTG